MARHAAIDAVADAYPVMPVLEPVDIALANAQPQALDDSPSETPPPDYYISMPEDEDYSHPPYPAKCASKTCYRDTCCAPVAVYVPSPSPVVDSDAVTDVDECGTSRDKPFMFDDSDDEFDMACLAVIEVASVAAAIEEEPPRVRMSTTVEQEPEDVAWVAGIEEHVETCDGCAGCKAVGAYPDTETDDEAQELEADYNARMHLIAGSPVIVID